MHYTRLQVARRISRKVFKNYHKTYPEFANRKTFKPSVEAMAGIYRKTRKICSKSCCGNPRKHFKQKTFHEIIADIDEKEQIEEFYET